jgi:hypothetical protein
VKVVSRIHNVSIYGAGIEDSGDFEIADDLFQLLQLAYQVVAGVERRIEVEGRPLNDRSRRRQEGLNG